MSDDEVVLVVLLRICPECMDELYVPISMIPVYWAADGLATRYLVCYVVMSMARLCSSPLSSMRKRVSRCAVPVIVFRAELFADPLEGDFTVKKFVHVL